MKNAIRILQDAIVEKQKQLSFRHMELGMPAFIEMNSVIDYEIINAENLIAEFGEAIKILHTQKES